MERKEMPLRCMYNLIVFFTLLEVIASVDIRQPPDITKSPPTLIRYRRQLPIDLECLFTGNPAPGIEWKKDNKTLELNSGRYEVSNQGRNIKIIKASYEDIGKYQCFVQNQYGMAMSDTTTLQMADLGSFVDDATMTFSANEGSPYKLDCVGAPYSVPSPPTFTWASVTDNKDNSPQDIYPSKRVQTDEAGSLHFAYVTKSDELDNRLYKCNVFNPVGDVTIGGSYSKLIVTSSGTTVPDSPPTLLFSSPDTVLGLVSNSVSFRCFFGAKPEAEITWSRVGGTLPNGRNELKNFNTELVLKDLRPTDAGNYTCQGRNPAGLSQIRTMILVIEAAPVFSTEADKINNVNVAQGESVTLRCASQATPPASVTWFRNAEPLIRNSLPQKYSLSADGLNLTISDVCKVCNPDSLSVIQCRATNTHGSAFSQGYVNVLVATEILDQSNRVEYKPGLDFTLPCVATHDDSIPSLSYTWYFQGSGDLAMKPIVYSDTIYFDNTTKQLNVKTKNDQDQGLGRVGEYTCEVSGGPIKGASITHSYFNSATVVQASFPWWIIGIVLGVLFVILLILLCYICAKRNKGDSYFVDEKERNNGNDPEQELLKDGFHDYHRPAGFQLNAEHGSISGSTGIPYNEDDSSLNAYAMSDPGKFQEDGSFIGQYNTSRSAAKVQNSP